MDIKDNWISVIQKYNLIKELFIECEETDPELKTNLQPLNEFKAALDHIMKLMGSYCFIGTQSNESCRDFEKEVEIQFDKLNSHLNRCFYDVSDMLSINIRNKIIDHLESFSPDDITKAIPNYYSEIRPHIERMGKNISKYRYEKGNNGVDTINRFNQYKNDILKLKEYYEIVLDKIEALEDIASKNKKNKQKENKNQWIINIVCTIIGVIVGAIITVFVK